MIRRKTAPALAVAAVFAGALATVLAAGCEANEVLAPAPLPDGGAISDDAANAKPKTDTLRKLVKHPLFSTMPPPNRFFDPEFGLLNGGGWNPIDYDAWELYQIRRVFLPRTPGDQPALELIKDEHKSEASVVGQAKGAAGPMLVSVWLGRRGEGEPAVDATVALLGLQLDGDPAATPLGPDGTAPLRLSGIRWQQLSAVLADGPVGDCYLRAANSSADSLFITSPVLQTISAEASAVQPSSRRGLWPGELSALRAVAWAKGQRFGSRRPRPRLPGRAR